MMVNDSSNIVLLFINHLRRGAKNRNSFPDVYNLTLYQFKSESYVIAPKAVKETAKTHPSEFPNTPFTGLILLLRLLIAPVENP